MKTRNYLAIFPLVFSLLGCQKNSQSDMKSNEEDGKKLMAILLPAVQRVREHRVWDPVSKGLDQSRITLTEDEYAQIHTTIGAPDIRIFIEGDTEKNGRSLPYTRLLNEHSRLVYHYEWDDKTLILYRQYTGSPRREDGWIDIESYAVGCSTIYPDFPSDMKSKEREQLMAILLPAVQKIREGAGRIWDPSPDGTLTIEADLDDEESGNISKTIGKPGIRIFLNGDTARNGRSLPYTTVVGGNRIVYYQENNHYEPDPDAPDLYLPRIQIRMQSTGSPTTHMASVENISMNYTRIK